MIFCNLNNPSQYQCYNNIFLFYSPSFSILLFYPCVFRPRHGVWHMWGGVPLHSPLTGGASPVCAGHPPNPTGCGPRQAPGSHRASACTPLPSSPCSAEAKGNREVWDNQSDSILNGSVCRMKQESTKPSRHRRLAPGTATPARQEFPADDRAGVKSVTRSPMSMQPSHPSVVKQRATASKAKGRHPGTAACPGHSTPGSAAGDTGP